MRGRAYLREATEFARTPYGAFVLGSLLGLLFFASFYGLKVLDPSFTSWLMVGGDLKQHFVGWEFFRSEPWTFPVGAIGQLAYPFGISLTYMDSIPLMAVPFKLFESVLPENFQYFGIWGLLCYMLQGGIAALIMRRWTKNTLVVLLCATVFIVSPILMARMFEHTALASHWVILLAIWAMLERSKLASIKKYVSVWSAILVIAAMVHPYFLPMVALPLIISLILSHRSWKESAIKVVVPLASAVVAFWVVGGLVVSAGSVASGGLGDYALNLNSLYNPLGWSRHVASIKNVSTSGESMNFLGLGILLLLPVVLYVTLRKLKSFSEIIASVKEKLRLPYILVAVTVIGFCILAISPRVQFGMRTLMDIDLPRKVEQLWSIFRASARLFWVVYYLIIVGVLAFIVRTWGKKSQALLVVFLLVFTTIQVVDIRTSLRAKTKHHGFSLIDQESYDYKPTLDVAQWERAVGSKKHIVYLEGMHPDDFLVLVDIALKYKLTMNTGYFARSPAKQIAEYQHEHMKLLMTKQANVEDNLYITRDKHMATTLRQKGYTTDRLAEYYVIESKTTKRP